MLTFIAGFYPKDQPKPIHICYTHLQIRCIIHTCSKNYDDETWTVRYLIVKTGAWLSGRKVLISPAALLLHSWESGVFPVNLTKEQVRHSPYIDTDKPVSRQQEAELATYTRIISLIILKPRTVKHQHKIIKPKVAPVIYTPLVNCK